MTAAIALLAVAAWAAVRATGDAPSPPATQEPLAQRPPSVVFVLADDLGWGDLSCYGHQQLHTPHIDRLAREGTLFTQFYVGAPVCSPSRGAFLTGRFPASLGLHDAFAIPRRNEEKGLEVDWLDPETPNVARLLHDAGYRTAHFGKWHLGRGKGAPEVGAYGFDEHRSTSATGPGWPDEADPGFRARSTELLVDEVLRFVEEDPERPFYVQCWTLLVHATLLPTEEQMAPFEPFGPEDVPWPGTKEVYYASVAELDRQIGRLLEGLDALGLADDTIVVFSSDNGPEDIEIRNASHSGIGSTGPFRGRKRSLYEGGVRMPLLVRWPGHVPAGRVEDAAVLAGVDFLPTLCALAGASLPDGLALDGEDASDVWLGASRPRTKSLLWERRYANYGPTVDRSPSLAIRSGPWKLLMNPDESRVELYDVPRDPTELHELSAGQPELVQRLARELLAWRATLPAGKVAPDAGGNGYPWPRPTK